MNDTMTRRFYSCLLFLFLAFISPLTHAADPAFSQQPDVQAFITKMVKQYKFNKKELVYIFNHVKMRPQVLHYVKKPLEKKTWGTYQRLFVNEWRIQRGVVFWDKYEDILRKAEKTYGVPASIIVATIGIETRYGQKMGGHRVIDSLSNLAFSDSPRAPFFRKELEHFLLLTREEKLDPLKVMGSYAGAMGQPQFMPSSYRRYAVNFSKSGKIDLMNDEADVIGSIGNYYKVNGWRPHQPIAVQAHINDAGINFLNSQTKTSFPLVDLTKHGIVPKTKIVQDTLKVKLLELEINDGKEYWLGFHNFYVIKRYNPSNLYAMAVFQLSNYITEIKKR